MGAHLALSIYYIATWSLWECYLVTNLEAHPFLWFLGHQGNPDNSVLLTNCVTRGVAVAYQHFPTGPRTQIIGFKGPNTII